jgi:hypothetical protein
MQDVLSAGDEARFIRIPISEVDLTTASFTYGDSFPIFDPTHIEIFVLRVSIEETLEAHVRLLNR